MTFDPTTDGTASPTAHLLEELHEDIYALTNGALDIVVAASATRGPGAGNATTLQPEDRKRRAYRTPPKFFQVLYSWFKGLRGYKQQPAASCF